MLKLSRITLWAFLVGTALAAQGAVARADDDHDHKSEAESEDRDHVLEALRRGEILPLPKLKSQVLEQWPGEIVALSVDRDHGRIRYEFRVLRPDGRLTEVEVDAADGSILEVENE
jgi:uncharacterized membrane protein YkoI